MLDRKIELPVRELSDLRLPVVADYTLKNGVRLTALDQGTQPVSRLSMVWPVGCTDIARPAVAEMMIAMLAEGTADMTGAEIADTIERQGAWLNADTTSHLTNLTVHFLNRTASEVLPVVLSVIARSTFPQEVFTRIAHRKAVARAVALKKVETIANEEANRLFFGPGHPLSRSVTPDDYLHADRDEVVRLHREIMLEMKPRVFLAGRVDEATYRSVEAMLESLPLSALQSPLHRVVLPPACPPEGAEGRVRVADSLQSAIRIKAPTITRLNPDHTALQAAVTLLGGYFGSRLMQNLREDKGYTYGISASLFSLPEGGQWVIGTHTDNRHVRGVLGEIDREIDRLCRQAPTEEELAAVRRYTVSSLASLMDSPFSAMNYYMMADANSLPRDYFSRELERLNLLTPEDLRLAAERYLGPAPRVTAIAGDWQN